MAATGILALFKSNPSRVATETLSRNTPPHDGTFVIWKEVCREKINEERYISCCSSCINTVNLNINIAAELHSSNVLWIAYMSTLFIVDGYHCVMFRGS